MEKIRYVNEEDPTDPIMILYEKMSKGDPRCLISIGSKVIKHWGEKGDIHQIGDTATVVGSIYDPDQPFHSDLYMVQFDNDAEHTYSLTIGKKIQLYEKRT